MFHRDACHREIYRRNIRDKRLQREACLHLGDVKVEMKRIMKTLSWRKDLKLNAAWCFSGTHATVRFARNSRDQRIPREACFDQGGCQVEKDIVTFNEEEDEDILVERGPQIERGMVFLRDTCDFL